MWSWLSYSCHESYHDPFLTCQWPVRKRIENWQGRDNSGHLGSCMWGLLKKCCLGLDTYDTKSVLTIVIKHRKNAVQCYSWLSSHRDCHEFWFSNVRIVTIVSKSLGLSEIVKVVIIWQNCQKLSEVVWNCQSCQKLSNLLEIVRSCHNC